MHPMARSLTLFRKSTQIVVAIQMTPVAALQFELDGMSGAAAQAEK